MCMVMGVRRRRVSKDKKNPPMWLDTKPKLGNEGVELKSENTRPLRPSRVSYASKGHVCNEKYYSNYFDMKNMLSCFKFLLFFIFS